jgi:hypothetical protein
MRRQGGNPPAIEPRGFVDAIYAKLLVVEDKDNDGNGGQGQRRRLANAALVACRRAWIVARHAQEKKVPAIDPSSRMGLKARAPADCARKTNCGAGRTHRFHVAARKLGYNSVSTGELLAWLRSFRDCALSAKEAAKPRKDRSPEEWRASAVAAGR